MKAGTCLAIPVVVLCGAVLGCQKAASTSEKPPTPVRAGTVEAYTATNAARYSASIAPHAQVDLAFRVGGYVEKIHQVRGTDGRRRNVQEGDSIAQGAVLAQVREKDYSVKVDQAGSQLAQARASLVTARRQLAEADVGTEKARLDFERAKALFAAESLTKPEFDAAKSQYDLAQAKVETARSQLAVLEASIRAAESILAEATLSKEDTLLRAPSSGILMQRVVEVGDLISPGKPAFVLADTRSVKAVFGVPDLDVQALRMGSRLAINFEALPARDFDGQITSISPSADPKTRLFQVEVSIPNPQNLLKVGMIATISLTAPGTRAEVAVVPLNAIIRSKERSDQYALFVIEEAGAKSRARLRGVNLGDAYGNRVAVLSGVRIGERVVTAGGSRLSDGEEVQVIP